MIKIAHLGSYDRNFGDNIALYNVRRVLDEVVDDKIHWTSIDLPTMHPLDFDWEHRNDEAPVRGKDKQHYIDMFKKISSENDMLIIGGGGMIQDYKWADHNIAWNLPFDEEVLSVIDIPIVCVSLGINLFRGTAPMRPETLENLKLLINKSELFSLRNDGSYENFKKLNIKAEKKVYETPDPGLVMEDHYILPEKEKIETGMLQPAWNGSSDLNVARFVPLRYSKDDLQHFILLQDPDLGLVKNKHLYIKDIVDLGGEKLKGQELIFRLYENVMKIRSLKERANLKLLYHTPLDINIVEHVFETNVSAWAKTPDFEYDYVLKMINFYINGTVDYSVAMRGHGQMVAIALNLPSLYFSTQDKVRDFSLKNGFSDYNVDIHEQDWDQKLLNKITKLRYDKEYLYDWYEIRDDFVLECKRNFYEYCNKIKSLLQKE